MIPAMKASNEPYRKALNTALRMLTRRDHSTHELTQKLRLRGYAGDVIDDVISECERFDYIDDKRTAQIVIRQLFRKGYGLKHIRFKLNLKGLWHKPVQDMLSQSITQADERQGAEKIFQKHIRRFEREKDVAKKKDKIYRFLYGRGFSETVISDLIGNIR